LKLLRLVAACAEADAEANEAEDELALEEDEVDEVEDVDKAAEERLICTGRLGGVGIG